jgi:hypothetical protein
MASKALLMSIVIITVLLAGVLELMPSIVFCVSVVSSVEVMWPKTVLCG